MRWGFKAIACILCIGIAASCGYTAGIRRSTSSEQTESDDVVTDPMEAFRLQRSRLRQSQIAQLNEIIRDEDTGPDTEALAQQMLIGMMDCSAKEAEIEGMLSMRGFDALLAVVSEDSAHIFVRQELLTDAQAAIILECVAAKTKITGGNVKIIPIK